MMAYGSAANEWLVERSRSDNTVEEQSRRNLQHLDISERPP